jgi:alcohol dehydrogenase-like protein
MQHNCRQEPFVIDTSGRERQAGVKIRGAVLEEIGRPRPYSDNRPIRVCDLELESPHEGEVRVRIDAAGLCHSDLSVVNGNRVRPVPMLLGHEAAGVVDDVGADVEDLAVGDHVVMTVLPRCGECDGCASGSGHESPAPGLTRLGRYWAEAGGSAARGGRCTIIWASRGSPRMPSSTRDPSLWSTPTSRRRSLP